MNPTALMITTPSAAPLARVKGLVERGEGAGKLDAGEVAKTSPPSSRAGW